MELELAIREDAKLCLLDLLGPLPLSFWLVDADQPQANGQRLPLF
jgi:hypothetical protein